MAKATNVTWHAALVSALDRQKVLGQRGCVIWLTGLSGSGKSTVARALEKRLIEMGRAAYVLDGDNVRQGLNSDLSFSPKDRDENIRRIGEVAALLADAGLVTVTAFISPYRSGRDRARQAARGAPFIEVHVSASVEDCRQRDPKGLYAKAAAGAIQDFTGVNAPYEPPQRAEIVLDTVRQGVRESVETVLAYLRQAGLLSDAAQAATFANASEPLPDGSVIGATKVTIRAGQDRDCQALADFQCRLARETERMELDPATVLAGVKALLDSPRSGTYWLVEVDGFVAGCAMTLPEWSDWRNGAVLWIHSVYVEPEYRRRGVFRALFQFLQRKVQADPTLKGLRLYVDKSNASAIGTYESLGMDGEHYRLFEWMKK